MKLKILKNFRVGSASDPKRIEKWIKMGWVEKVTFP